MFLGPVHTHVFLFQKAYFLLRFRLSSTLKTFENADENGDFRKRSCIVLETLRF